MKKTICKKEYDTDTASLVKKYTFGQFGDPAGYEEALYQNGEGSFFLFVRGGETSPYPTADIKRIGSGKAESWLAAH